MGGKMTGNQRFEAKIAKAVADKFIELVGDCCERIEVAGSLRRGKPTVGDIDLVVIPKDEERLNSWLIELFGHQVGDPKKGNRSGVMHGIQIDVNVATKETFWAQMCHCTGSVQENCRLRSIAKRNGLSISQYGVKVVKTEKMIRLKSEEHLYELLNEEFVKPEDR